MKYLNQILISGFLVWFFAIIGTAAVSFTEQQTYELIAENERQMLLRNLNQLIPKERYDNDLSSNSIILEASELLGNTKPKEAYRASLKDKPVAIIFNATAHNGYSGDIDLLVAVYVDGSIAGVRVVKHKETPGLGDGIEIKKSNWIKQFDLKSLLNPLGSELWKVKRDGGVFDQMTGATITPRAIIQTTYQTLQYYQNNSDTLFSDNMVSQ
ncbi:MAG: electron transport complex subunit RsxG [Gammaproteobacteria bacterium]|nr:electron transport complex subunit RsxG [Gammaproteobacteria bacterium]